MVGPQSWRLLRTHDRDGVSAATYVVWATSSFAWVWFSASIHAWPAVAGTAPEVLLTTAVLVMLRPRPGWWAGFSISILAIGAEGLVASHSLWVPASILTIALGWPSVGEALRPGATLTGVSVPTWVLAALSESLWAVYDFGIHWGVAAIPAIVLTLASLLVIVRVLLVRRRMTTPSVLPRSVESVPASTVVDRKGPVL